MEIIRTSKEILKEWVEANMAVHSDWTGNRVETKSSYESIEAYESIEKFVDKLYEYLCDNHYRC